MAYVQPNTTIYFYENVPLDPTQEHTIYFGDVLSQQAYFNTKVRHSVERQSYQRVERNRCRVALKAAQLYPCNYMMFQNSAYGSKRFYAFITAVEYVNDNTTDVFYEIDPIQTWIHAFEFGSCLVEREHPVSDRIGEHILPEPVDLGEYEVSNYQKLIIGTPVTAVMYVDSENAAANGVMYDNVFCGAKIRLFSDGDSDGLRAFLSQYIQQPDAIISIYTLPIGTVAGTPSKGGTDLKDGAHADSAPIKIEAIHNTDFIGSYKPKNRKLYTYPYNFYILDNGSGQTLPLRYEYFEDLTVMVVWKGCITQPVKMLVQPYNYKGAKGAYRMESIELSDYPLCGWNNDSFQAWIAQSALPTIGGAIASTVASGGNPVTFGMNMANIGIQAYKSSIAADVCRGSTNTGNVNIAQDDQWIYGGRMHVQEEYARYIDEYFTRYGYNVQRLGKPLVNSRPHWNYIKTRGCCILGSVPADDAKAICQIHDRGITYWAKGDEVGNYNQDNSPGA